MAPAMKGKGPDNLQFEPGLSDHHEGIFINWIYNF